MLQNRRRTEILIIAVQIRICGALRVSPRRLRRELDERRLDLLLRCRNQRPRQHTRHTRRETTPPRASPRYLLPTLYPVPFHRGHTTPLFPRPVCAGNRGFQAKTTKILAEIYLQLQINPRNFTILLSRNFASWSHTLSPSPTLRFWRPKLGFP